MNMWVSVTKNLRVLFETPRVRLLIDAKCVSALPFLSFSFTSFPRGVFDFVMYATR